MDIAIVETKLPGVVVVESKIYGDARGFFAEVYHHEAFERLGLPTAFVQDNHSRSSCGVLRGFHYQDMRAPMAKLVRCSLGAVLDVVVDLRVGSPAFGQWVATELHDDQLRQVVVPIGFGHAFLTLSEVAEVQYKCTGYYAPEAEGGLAWNDPDIAVAWPTLGPALSTRDQHAQSLRQYLEHPAFTY